MAISILDDLTPLTEGPRVHWRYIGGEREVVEMDYQRRSTITGEPVFVIRYREPGEDDRQRLAYASDLFLTDPDGVTAIELAAFRQRT